MGSSKVSGFSSGGDWINSHMYETNKAAGSTDTAADLNDDSIGKNPVGTPFCIVVFNHSDKIPYAMLTRIASNRQSSSWVWAKRLSWQETGIGWKMMGLMDILIRIRDTGIGYPKIWLVVCIMWKMGSSQQEWGAIKGFWMMKGYGRIWKSSQGAWPWWHRQCSLDIWHPSAKYLYLDRRTKKKTMTFSFLQYGWVCSKMG